MQPKIKTGSLFDRPLNYNINLFNPLSDSQRNAHVICNLLTFGNLFLIKDVNYCEFNFRNIFYNPRQISAGQGMHPRRSVSG